MIALFDDGSPFSDGAGFVLWRPPLFNIGRPRLLVFCDPCGRGRSGIARHPTAQTYTFGPSLFASIVPYPGSASVVLVDTATSAALATKWAPECGFNPDPGVWLNRRRGRLAAGSPGHTILELSALLPGLVADQLEAMERDRLTWFEVTKERGEAARD
jgi:hypothetical protein